ncbi:MAG: hypothetical protein AB7J46_06435 [Candidatus Altimarinota bacterium]
MAYYDEEQNPFNFGAAPPSSQQQAQNQTPAATVPGWESTFDRGVAGTDEAGGGGPIDAHGVEGRMNEVAAGWQQIQDYYNKKRQQYGFDFDIQSYYDDLVRGAQYDRSDVANRVSGRIADIDKRFADGDGGSGGSGGSNSGSSGTAGWLPSSGGSSSSESSSVTSALAHQAELIKQMMEQQRLKEIQNRERGDALYAQLLERANQSLDISPDLPVIKAQTEAFAAAQERARRNYLSDLAESSGPYANLRGEERMAMERAGQAVGGLTAQLMGRELEARRAEIQAALNGAAGLLTADQELNLRKQLGLLDNMVEQQRTAISGHVADTGRLSTLLQDRQFYSGLDSQDARFGAELGLDSWSRARELEAKLGLPVGSLNFGF